MGNQPSDRKTVRGDGGITAGGDVNISDVSGTVNIGNFTSNSKGITEEKYEGDAMVGGAKLHEKIGEYLNMNYNIKGEFEIASLTKTTSNDNSDLDYYKVKVNYKRTGDTYSKSASVKVDSNTGEIIGFKECLNEARFLAAFKKNIRSQNQNSNQSL